MRYRVAKYGFNLLLALLLSGCASQIPQIIREAPADSPSLAQVREQAADHLGQPLRWGGTIIETDNRENTTWLTVLGRPLYKDGEPKSTDDSDGRFIAIVPEFLDPKVYAADRRITITGTLLRTEDGKVGEHAYTYPVVQAQAWYLWARETEWPYRYGDPWYPRPWWYHRGYHPYGDPYYYYR